MDRHWLLTWTTYGTWLPGDARGFVSNVPHPSGVSVRHNRPQSTPEADVPWMRSQAAALLVSEPVRLTRGQAEVVCDQFYETARVRGWELAAAAVMANHVHLVVGVRGDPEPGSLLRDFKSYASRQLNLRFGRRARWWTEGGSTRKLPDANAVRTAVEYVLTQEYPLVVRRNSGERPA
ncbi:MAG: transposase [Fimbriiglobus sp.]|nr:transposase [Fimbriiglobus sp.]